MAGSITPYETAQGKRYRVRCRKPDKSQTDKRGFRTKKEAELFLASVTVSKASGEYVDPRDARVTISRLSAGWLASKKATLKPSTYSAIDSTWTKHVEPTWGSREIARIKPSEIQDWVTRLSDIRSATTVKRALGILAGILDTAVDDRRLPRNPAAKTNTPRKKPKARVYLTHGQLHALATASARPELILFLGYTGLRWGEAAGLKVKHIDLFRRRVAVAENAVYVRTTIHVRTPKTHELRSVPFLQFLTTSLINATRGKGPDAIVFGDGSTYLRPPKTNGCSVLRSTPSRRQNGKRLRLLPARKERSTPVSRSQGLPLMTSATPPLHSRSVLFEDDLDDVAKRLHKRAVAAGVGRT